MGPSLLAPFLLLTPVAWPHPTSPLLWNLGGHAFASQPEGSLGQTAASVNSAAQLPGQSGRPQAGYDPSEAGQARPSTIQDPSSSPAIMASAREHHRYQNGSDTSYFGAIPPSTRVKINYDAIQSTGYGAAQGNGKAFQSVGYTQQDPSPASGQVAYGSAGQTPGFNSATSSSYKQQATDGSYEFTRGTKDQLSGADGSYSSSSGWARLPGDGPLTDRAAAGRADSGPTSLRPPSHLTPDTSTVQRAAAAQSGSGRIISPWEPMGAMLPSEVDRIAPSGSTADVLPSANLQNAARLGSTDWSYGDLETVQGNTGPHYNSASQHYSTQETTPSRDEMASTTSSTEGMLPSQEPNNASEPSEPSEEQEDTTLEPVSDYGVSGSSGYSTHQGSADMTWRYGAYREPTFGNQPLPAGLGLANSVASGFVSAASRLVPPIDLNGNGKGDDDDEGGRHGELVPIFIQGGSLDSPAWGYFNSLRGDDD